MHAILMTAVLAVVPTNMELAEDALEAALQGLAEHLEALEVDRVYVEMEGEHPGNWFVRQTVLSVLREGGIGVVDGESRPDSVPVLRVRPMEIRVEYGNVGRSWVIGTKKVDRIAECELMFTLLDRDGAVLDNLRTGGRRNDRVSWSEAETAKGSGEWDWLSEDLPEDVGGGILEPVVVTGIVASLIYLFYSSRAE